MQAETTRLINNYDNDLIENRPKDLPDTVTVKDDVASLLDVSVAV